MLNQIPVRLEPCVDEAAIYIRDTLAVLARLADDINRHVWRSDFVGPFTNRLAIHHSLTGRPRAVASARAVAARLKRRISPSLSRRRPRGLSRRCRRIARLHRFPSAGSPPGPVRSLLDGGLAVRRLPLALWLAASAAEPCSVRDSAFAFMAFSAADGWPLAVRICHQPRWGPSVPPV